jgi:radical SAM superfamily enzyme YgiQ (UPF0313 family)
MNLFTITLKNVWHRKIRTGLTILGVGISVAAFVSFMGLANNLEEMLETLYKSRGTDLVVEKGTADILSSVVDGGYLHAMKELPGVVEVSPVLAHSSRAKELFRALIPLKIRWLGQATIGAAQDRELIQLAWKSGCVAVCVGLESLSRQSLASVSKAMNKVEEYERNLKAYRKKGIFVIASIMFGLDGEPASIFKDTYEFLVKNRVPYTGWKHLYPYPGTAVFKRLKEQGSALLLGKEHL